MANQYIQGLDGLLEKLRDLPDKVQKKHVWGAALAGAAVIRKAAVANAKKIDKNVMRRHKGYTIDGQIFKAIKYQAAKRSRVEPGSGMYRVGVQGGASGKTRNPPSYWRHVEFGTEDTPAQPFLRPAMNDNQQAVFDRVAKSLGDRIMKEADKGMGI